MTAARVALVLLGVTFVALTFAIAFAVADWWINRRTATPIRPVLDLDVWVCHVCGEQRPDAVIAVCSITQEVHGIPITCNVRYCRDRPACRAGAPAVARKWAGG